MPEKLTLYVCSLDDGGPKIHPCRRASEALEHAGIEVERVVFDKNRPLGLFTKGKRPELKKLSGQEKLPVLQLADGTTIAPSSAIIKWAREHASN